MKVLQNYLDGDYWNDDKNYQVQSQVLIRLFDIIPSSKLSSIKYVVVKLFLLTIVVCENILAVNNYLMQS